MIARLARLAVRIGMPVRFGSIAAWAAVAAIALAIGGGSVLWLLKRGEAAGGAKVEARVAKRDQQARVETRVDERLADATVAAIGADVIQSVRASDAQLSATRQEVRNAFDAIPPAAAAASPLPAPVDRLRDALNRAAADANRAADAADAGR